MKSLPGSQPLLEKSLPSLSLGFWEEAMMPLPAFGFPSVLSSPRVRLLSPLSASGSLLLSISFL